MSYQATPPTAIPSTSSRPPTMNPSTSNINGGVPPPNMNVSTSANVRAGITTGVGLGPQSTSEGIGKGVPAFLVKLYSMINEPKTDELIYWSEDGKSFFIPNSQKFGGTLLPQFFKHANFTSFVRQLNMYGFKKVPHLQAAVLSSFAPSSSRPSSSQPSTPELWEFTNPKFMRSHPELLGSITRKKSAKEIAAAQHAHGEHDEGGKEEDVDMDGEIRVVHEGKGKKEEVSEASVSRALTLMHATHSSLEKEMQALKSSNEMLWRQWMLSREEQMKSEKKVDSIMRFLSGQFGGMNMVELDGETSGSGVGNVATTPKESTPRIRRLGGQKMIGDGVRGLEGSPGEDVVTIDGRSPSEADNEIWEFDESGNLVKMKTNKPKTLARPIARASTPTRRFNTLSTTGSKSRSASPHRFINLDGSPEEQPLGSFDQNSNTREGSPVINGAISHGSGTLPGTLFPTASAPPTNPRALTSTTLLQPSPSSALTPYQPSINLSYLSSNLDPALLQLPLGALLGSAAGAQLLASLSHIAAYGLPGQQQPAQQPAQQLAPQPPQQQTANVTSLTPTPTVGTPTASTESADPSASTSTSNGTGWNALPSDLQHQLPQIPPVVDVDDPLQWLNASASGPSTQPLDMEFLDPTLMANAVNGTGEVNWNDPDMAQLLSQLENPNLDAEMAGGDGDGGGVDTSGFDAFDMGDKHMDFDEFFGEPAGEEGHGDGMEFVEGFKEPTRKKRKTDDRR